MDRDLLKQQDDKKTMNEAYITKAEIIGNAGLIKLHPKPSLLKRLLRRR